MLTLCKTGQTLLEENMGMYNKGLKGFVPFDPVILHLDSLMGKKLKIQSLMMVKGLFTYKKTEANWKGQQQ